MGRIVLVEDDEPFRRMLHEILVHAGHEVESVEDGEAALRQLHRAAVELVITDLLMPEKEGIELLLELRFLHPEVRIIAISGGGRTRPEHNLEPARRLGAGRVLAKPFSRQEILDAIDAVISPPASE